MKRTSRLNKEELHTIFLSGLGSHVSWHSDKAEFPLLVDLLPRKVQIRVYLWNCTNPPGGRALDEYKTQITLPGQVRRTRAHLDYSKGRIPIVGALIQEDAYNIFAFWDADMHEDFGYSANLQVKADAVIGAMYSITSEAKRHNGEIIVCAKAENIYDALLLRFKISQEKLLRGV